MHLDPRASFIPVVVNIRLLDPAVLESHLTHSAPITWRASYLDRGKREATRKMLNRGRIPFHPLVGPPHVPAMDAGPERCELSHQRRVGASDVLRVLLRERSGSYRLIQVLVGPDSFSHRFNQLTQIGQVTAQDCPRSQQPVPRNNCAHLE